MKKHLALLTTALLGLVLLPPPPAGAADFGATPNLLLTTPEVDAGAPLGNRLVFAANTAAGGEPMMTDGTRAGTRLLKDLNPGPTGSDAQSFTAHRGLVYFVAAHGGTLTLWVTNGTAGGTRMVRSPDEGGPRAVSQLTSTDGLLFFVANDGTHGHELWSTDGTAANTGMVRDLRDGTDGAAVNDLTTLGTKVVFSASPVIGVGKPYVSDGTFAGTQRLDVEPADRDLFPGEFAVLGDQVLFKAGNQFSGGELWTTRGVPGDAHGIKDIRPGTGGSNPRDLTLLGDQMIFTAFTDNVGREVWATDGTYSGTQQLRDINETFGGSDPQALVVAGDTLFFTANDEVHGTELWSTRGSTASTRMVRDIWPGASSGAAETDLQLAAVGRRLFFRADDGRSGLEPWVSDGTAAGTRRVADLAPGATPSSAAPIGVVGRTILFSASLPTESLWSWTASGSTTRIAARRAYTQKAAARKQIVVTVAVRGEGVTPTGRVVLRRGAKVVGSGTLVRGVAKVRITTKLGKGTHRLRASYAGSVNARTSVSPFVTFRIR